MFVVVWLSLVALRSLLVSLCCSCCYDIFFKLFNDGDGGEDGNKYEVDDDVRRGNLTSE
ncbi:hypothetical protein Scep_001592 [Stephania cephalantha]|uniref:Uncharacterized protein n=1 Tax=Stephania cephalantha TaxID=152367 RepID=A0AAP0L8H4_9MAGN